MKPTIYGQFKYVVSHRRKRPWGDEIRFAVYDKDTGDHIRTVTLRHNVKTETTDIEACLDKLAVSLTEPEPEPEKLMPESEIIELLKAKEFLSEGETLADLKTLTELGAAEVVK